MHNTHRLVRLRAHHRDVFQRRNIKRQCRAVVLEQRHGLPCGARRNNEVLRVELQLGGVVAHGVRVGVRHGCGGVEQAQSHAHTEQAAERKAHGGGRGLAASDGGAQLLNGEALAVAALL